MILILRYQKLIENLKVTLFFKYTFLRINELLNIKYMKKNLRNLS